MRFGAIKVWAHRLVAGESIPIFRDNAANRAINDHADAIRRARTRRARHAAGCSTQRSSAAEEHES
jgi:hypothetical protein